MDRQHSVSARHLLQTLSATLEELRHQHEALAAAHETVVCERQRYQELFDLAPDGYVVTDLLGVIREANRAAVAMLALPQGELLRKPLVLFIPRGERQRFSTHLQQLRRHCRRVCWEMRLQPREGSPGVVEVTVTPATDAMGKPVGLRWLLQDIPERTQAQTALQEALDALDRRVCERTAYLRQLNDRLLAEIVERRHMERALRQSEERLRQLTAHLHAMQEQERARIARELHDDLAQILTGLRFDVSWLAKQRTIASSAWKQRVQSMQSQIEDLRKSVHRIGTELRPTILDDLGLFAALEWQLQQTCRRTGLRYTLHLPDEDKLLLDAGRATALFRICQETLSNVVRHAEASAVAVQVLVQPDTLLLQVADNGKGISPEQAMDRNALGLLGMRERAALWGGQVTLHGTPGQGTTVTVSIPYAATAGEMYDSCADRR